MIARYEKLPKKDRVPLQLRSLYEQKGYSKFTMSKFESYDMYYDNKDFLKNDGIITFTDFNGKLMALKPDVTMSIVKSTNKNSGVLKYYYNENVYRAVGNPPEYKEINQMGLELIGGDGIYSEIEVIELALKSLGKISSKNRIVISHMSFINLLLNELGYSNEIRKELVEIIQNKKIFKLDDMEIKEKDKEYIRQLVNISGDYLKGLEKAKKLCFNEKMKNIVCELEEIYEAIKLFDLEDNLYLDFSIINHIEYYNGLIFKGYIDGIPKAILRGGRYDRLMEKFNKNADALGFAIYIGDLERYLKEDIDYDVDAKLIYGDAKSNEIIEAMKVLEENYLSVRAEKVQNDNVKAGIEYILKNGRMEEK